ncbi:Site-specific recombinase XerD [Sediminibacterium ginsengisoli]|uniref:Site-specific recombinase XerD n=2 Tax=Sediminibacterium ginsengisoli TaxID=413434 RepID=A0A1T4NG26_9BACT|nr:Site-specific recombinase XerD [Sediminibacterium ginsengisoli]
MPNVTLQTLSPSTVTQFFKELERRKRILGNGKAFTGIKKSTVITYWSKLHTYFEWLVRNKHITENPFRYLRKPRVIYDDVKFLKKWQVERILSALHNPPTTKPLIVKRNLAIFYVLLFCGLRREELALLQLRDIDIERKLLTVRAETSKIPRTRHIPLHSSVCMYLKEYLKERVHKQSQYVFISNLRDDGISLAGLISLVQVIRKRSGVRFHLHQFRHTFAVNFLYASNDIVKLQRLMGHTNITMTMAYLRCLPSYKTRADLENMRIDEFV